MWYEQWVRSRPSSMVLVLSYWTYQVLVVNGTGKPSTFCWRKIRNPHQADGKPNEDSLTHVPDPKRASQFSWNWQTMKNS
jgi:hypothetical protein